MLVRTMLMDPFVHRAVEVLCRYRRQARLFHPHQGAALHLDNSSLSQTNSFEWSGLNARETKTNFCDVAFLIGEPDNFLIGIPHIVVITNT
jgi:hypothetical protein